MPFGPPRVDFDDPRAKWGWDSGKFSMRQEALFGDLWYRYNTITIPLQDPEAFYADVTTAARKTGTNEEFFEALAAVRDSRSNELKKALVEIGYACLYGESSLLGGPPGCAALLEITRNGSLDSFVHFVGGIAQGGWSKSKRCQLAIKGEEVGRRGRVWEQKPQAGSSSDGASPAEPPTAEASQASESRNSTAATGATTVAGPGRTPGAATSNNPPITSPPPEPYTPPLSDTRSDISSHEKHANLSPQTSLPHNVTSPLQHEIDTQGYGPGTVVRGDGVDDDGENPRKDDERHADDRERLVSEGTLGSRDKGGELGLGYDNGGDSARKKRSFDSSDVGNIRRKRQRHCSSTASAHRKALQSKSSA